MSILPAPPNLADPDADFLVWPNMKVMDRVIHKDWTALMRLINNRIINNNALSMT